MLKNFIKIAWRNLMKHKGFSLINITGLGIGLACFLLITLYVIDEMSYDRYHDKAGRIYRVHSDVRFGGTDLHMAVSSDMTGQVLKKDYQQVEQYTRIYTSSGNKLVKKGKDFINELRVAHADSTIFEVFSFPAIEGDLHTALNEPNTVVLTEKTARKYFGSTSAIGRFIETNDNGNTVYKVTAVIQDMPENSHFNFDMIFSMDNVNYNWGSFLSHNFFTYLLLKEGTDSKAFEKNFDQYIAKYVIPQAREYLQIPSMDEFEKAGNKLQYSLMPLTRIHLYSDTNTEMRVNGNIQYVYIFSAVALFILIIACINFMNLTTARSAGRAKEVGIRKVLGTSKKQLVRQFLSEATLMVIISMILALVAAFFMLPVFNEMSGKTMQLSKFFSPQLLPVLLIFPFVVGMLAGSYPAFYLSSFQPIQVLKGKLNLGTRGGGLRSTLVVFQFATSIILIVGTIVIYRQLGYIQTKNLGFNKDQVLVINDAYALQDNTQAFKNAMLTTPGVLNGSFSGFLPVSASSRNDNTFSAEAVMDTKNGFNMQCWWIDEDYLETMGMELLKGRNFSDKFISDSTAVLINETAAKRLGHADPIGKKLYTSDPTSGTVTAYNIIGVVKNFHFESMKQTIGPLCMLLGNSTWSASFKVNAANIPTVLKAAEANWKSMAPGMPFSYRFLDESFQDMYRAELRVGRIAMIFSILAIFIACLGLFGLATFVAEQRTKEIGIRKVLGATTSGIARLLSKEFVRLVLISFIIATPVSWYFMNRWLEDFAYRVDIHWWMFLVAGILTLLIALATVSFQAVKAAMSNPVRNLRTE
jgi:putative ABC transport system permease protein